MIGLHGIWTSDVLHVFGERLADDEPSDRSSTTPAESAPCHPFALNEDELRDVVGDLTDSLLVTGAGAGQLTLQLPTRNNRPLPSDAGATGSLRAPHPLAAEDAECHWRLARRGFQRSATRAGKLPVAPTTEAPTAQAPGAVSLRPWRLASLVFPPPDAVDLLTTLAAFEHHDLRAGASLRYWATAARLVQDLLARQQFVPDVYRRQRSHTDEYHGLWRVMANEERTSSIIGRLIACMPPVCRSFNRWEEPGAAELVESFLWRTVDGVVRRCLEGDELARAIQGREREAPSLETRWLASLVRPDATIVAPHDDCRTIRRLVDGWVSRLEVDQRRHRCRTCFCLHAPEPAAEISDLKSEGEPSHDEEGKWKLTFHIQSIDNPSLVLDAEHAYDPPTSGPAVLGRPFESIADQLREDLARAAVHFPPLQACLDEDQPVECNLTLSAAHRFLREAA